MDLKLTGKFIADMRKAKGLTQAKLAEKLMVSEKTVSKWECGKGFPDTTLMLPLCNELGITANELLSAKKLQEEEYKGHAEQNLVELKDANLKANKMLLNAEMLIGFMSTIAFLLMDYTAVYFVENTAMSIVLLLVGMIGLFVAVFFCLRIEREVGYYQCAKCGHKYIPTYNSIMGAMHYGRSRYLKCPHCGKKSWNKKVLEKD